MLRLEAGMLIKTSYSDKVYRVLSVIRGCTCPSYTNSINMSKPPERRPHIHVICSQQDGTGRFHLNDYDESTLRNLERPNDAIVVLPQDRPVQMSMALL